MVLEVGGSWAVGHSMIIRTGVIIIVLDVPRRDQLAPESKEIYRTVMMKARRDRDRTRAAQSMDRVVL